MKNEINFCLLFIRLNILLVKVAFRHIKSIKFGRFVRIVKSRNWIPKTAIFRILSPSCGFTFKRVRCNFFEIIEMPNWISILFKMLWFFSDNYDSLVDFLGVMKRLILIYLSFQIYYPTKYLWLKIDRDFERFEKLCSNSHRHF